MIREYGKKVGHIIPFEKPHDSSMAVPLGGMPACCS
jgi:hypothetical protein